MTDSGESASSRSSSSEQIKSLFLSSEKNQRLSFSNYFHDCNCSSSSSFSPTEFSPVSELSFMTKLEKDVVGANSGFWGPFGWQKYTNVDFAASGRPLKCIESFIEKEVLPHYANTHTTVSHSAMQTTIFRDEARTIVKQSVGGLEMDEVIFCGAGATSAVHKLVHSVSYPGSRKIVVFVGPYEHHSTILPWREYGSKVIQVPIDINGHVDTNFLEKRLRKLTRWCDGGNQLIVGCFSAGSNVTGALTDDIAITKLLHKYGALGFWDYAGAAPHAPINMNPKDAPKDALYFSGHKFLGGTQTPGVLVVKKHVLQNPVPHGVGGGTVLFTTRKRHQYVQNIHEREEGGTPDIVGSIRLGLLFRLRNMIGVREIVGREATFCRRILQAWRSIPEIHILGSTDDPRLPFVSFVIEHTQTGYFLHHNFVAAVLNDLFGIQCRGGCMCAGPYSQTLLGIDDKLARRYERMLEMAEGGFRKRSNSKFGSKYGALLKPGFVRTSLSYHSSLEEVDFLIEAVKLVARHGWKLLPFYKICWEKGTFLFNAKGHIKKPSSLASFDKQILSDKMSLSAGGHNEKVVHSCFTFSRCLQEAKFILTEMTGNLISGNILLYPVNPGNKLFSSELNNRKLMEVRWFMSQYESVLLQQCSYFPFIDVKSIRPFEPLKFRKAIGKVSSWTEGSIPSQLGLVWKRQSTSEKVRRCKQEKLLNQNYSAPVNTSVRHYSLPPRPNYTIYDAMPLVLHASDHLTRSGFEKGGDDQSWVWEDLK